MTVSDEPRLVNLVEIDTRFGPRAFELRHGDAMARVAEVDLIAVSVKSTRLDELRRDPSGWDDELHTVFGALRAATGIDVAELSQQPAVDLRAALGWWAAETSSAPAWVACLEDIEDRPHELAEALDGLFVLIAFLEAKGVQVRTAQVPLLGAGDAGMPLEGVLGGILEAARRHLPRLDYLERILFVERNEAKVDRLDVEMDRVLDRKSSRLARDQLTELLRGGVLARLAAVETRATPAERDRIEELRQAIEAEETRALDVGVAARKLVEAIVSDVESTPRTFDLLGRIERLGEVGLSRWIRSYMHLVRVVGNEVAHARPPSRRFPAEIRDADLALCLHGMKRLLEFWADWQKSGRSG